MDIKVMRAWDSGRNKISYVYRNPNTGKTKIGECKFINWFYVKLEDFESNKSLFYKLRDDKKITGFEVVNKYVKIFVDTIHNNELLNKDMEWVWEYKNFVFNQLMDKLNMMNIQTYEADVKAFKRWLIRDNVKIETEYNILYYDIETDDRHADGLTPGKYRILSIAAKSSDSNNKDGKMFFLYTKEDSDDAEKHMLENFAKLINRHDVLISFNGMNFDDPYIKSRFVRYGIEIDWRKKFTQDHCWAYKKYGPKLTSYSLDNIANSVLERGKVKHSGLRIWDMWKDDKQLLKKYNIEDVQLMYEIECKTGFLSAHRDICAEGKCPVDDLYVSRKIDNFILKQAEDDNEYHFKTVERNQEHEDIGKFEGAFVFPPVPGRHESVKVVDFGSLYPNIINTFNISPDTLIENKITLDGVDRTQVITTPNGYKFRKDFIGILPKVVMRLKTKRDYYKGLMAKETPNTMAHKVLDRMQYLYKYFGLSFYGCMGEKHNRAYDVRIAEAVTLTGQYMTKKCAEYCEKNNIKVTYGDSITKERNTVIRRNGKVEILSFEEMFEQCQEVYLDRGKEIGLFYEYVEVMSYNFDLKQSEWKNLKSIIRHKTKKQVYLYRYREGITKITEDHSLIDKDGNCFKPNEHFNAFSIPSLGGQEITNFDLSEYINPYSWISSNGRHNELQFLDGYITIKKYNKKRFLTSVSEKNLIPLLRLCAHYICNGSSSTLETTSRFMFSIASQDIALLNTLKGDLSIFFPDSHIIVRHSDSGVNYKVVVSNCIAAICFKQLCGQKYYGKKIPNFVYNLPKRYQKFFIREMMKGDGTITKLDKDKESYDFECASVNVVSGLAYLLRLNGEKITCQTNGDKGTFTIKSRITDNVGNWNIKNIVKPIEYDDFVYDLSVEGNNNFVDAMGNILLHNTDSLFVSGLKGHKTVKKLANKLSDLCELHSKKKFNCDKCTILMEYDKGFKVFISTDAKKRYAGTLDYLDGNIIDYFNMYVAGFEYKRTDTCKILKEKQYELLKMLLQEDCPHVREVREFILDLKKAVFAKKLTVEDITFAQKVTRELDDYEGRQMHVMVAREMIEDGKEVWVGDKVPYYIIGIDFNKKPIPKPVYKFDGRYCESYYWNNKIFPGLQRILEVVYPNYDWASYKSSGSANTKLGRTNLW